MDVLPDIKLRPVGKREHANISSTWLLKHSKAQVSGFSIQRWFCLEKSKPALRPGFFFIPACTTKSSIKSVFIQCLLECLSFHYIGMFRAAMGKFKPPAPDLPDWYAPAQAQPSVSRSETRSFPGISRWYLRVIKERAVYPGKKLSWPDAASRQNLCQ